MHTYLCEICGHAYLGEEKPSSCPFCGARKPFIKLGKEAKPITQVKERLSDATLKNLRETLELETMATAIYRCMAGKAKSIEVKQMYKSLSKVESEHIDICMELLGLQENAAMQAECSESDIENFQKTVDLEDHAAHLYMEFARTSPERHIKIMFTALAQAEEDHIRLIRNYLE